VRGHVARKGRRYYPVVDIGPDPETGRRRRKWHDGTPSKDEAERALTDILSRLDAGTYVESSRQTLSVFLVEDWLPGIGKTRRPTTVALMVSLSGPTSSPTSGISGCKP
jgi:hypothetical protein